MSIQMQHDINALKARADNQHSQIQQLLEQVTDLSARLKSVQVLNKPPKSKVK